MAIFQSWEQRNTALIRQFQQKIILEKVTKICTIPIVHSATGQQATLGTGGGHRG